MKSPFKITRLFKLKCTLRFIQFASLVTLLLIFVLTPWLILLAIYYMIAIASINEKIAEEMTNIKCRS